MSSLVTAMDAFFSKVEVDLDDTSFTFMSNARRDTAAFGLGDSGNVSSFDLVDLGDLVEHYADMAPAEADELLQAINACVPYMQAESDKCTGLTVYHPFWNKKQMAARSPIYNGLTFSENYRSYVQSFSSILTGTPLADWTGLETEQEDAVRLNRSVFTLKLTEDQSTHFGEADMVVLQQLENGNYTFVSRTEDIGLDDQSALTGEYTGVAVYAADSEGQALTPTISYTLDSNGRYLVPADLTLVDQAGEEVIHQAMLICSENDKFLTPDGVAVYDGEGYTTIFGTAFEDYKSITLHFEEKAPADASEGVLSGFEDWTVVNTQDWTFPIDDSWHLELKYDSIDTENLYATFQVTDSQNNCYSSQPACLSVKATGEGEVRLSYDDLDTVLIEKANVLANAGGDMTVSLSLTNLLDNEVIIALENLQINGTEYPDTTEVYGTGENYGLVSGETQVLLLNVPAAELDGVSEITSVQWNLKVLDAATDEELKTVPAAMSMQLAR